MKGLRDAALVALVGLAAWPVCSKAVEVRDLLRSGSTLACLTNLAALASGLEGGSAVCPASKRPYRAAFAADAQVFGCDDPGEHLRIPMRFLRTGTLSQVRMTLPDFPAVPGRVELATTKVKTVLTLSDGAATIHLEKKPWERFLLMPLAALAGLAAFVISGHFTADSHLETRRELARAPGVTAWLGTALRGLARLGLWTGIMVWAAFLMAVGLRGAGLARDITVFKERGVVSIQDRWFGRAWTGPKELPDVVAVVPVAFGKRYYRVFALFPEDGRVGRQFLFTVGEAEAGVVAGLQRPPAFSLR